VDDWIERDSGLLIKGSQTPRILHLPTSADPELGTSGQAVRDLAASCGLMLDPWQAALIDEACTYRRQAFFNPYTEQTEYKWAATEVGLMISRQNGKGSILEARELAGLFLFGERMIIHSAHQFDTSKEAFERILSLIEANPELEALIANVTRSHGEEGIKLKPVIRGQRGQQLRFRTRTKSGGRGFTGDCLILDEAMILESAMVKALMPTLVARPNAQIWYTGSAGDEDSEQFGRVRQRGIDGTDARLLYAEWSIDPHTMYCDPDTCDEHDDPASPYSWAKANAAMNIADDHGVQQDGLETDFNAMSPEDFAAEHLGVGTWPIVGAGWRVISKAAYDRAGLDGMSSLVDKTKSISLGIDVSPDSLRSSIFVAGYSTQKTPTGADCYHVELAQDGESFDWRPGTQWVVDRAVQICKRNRVASIIIDPSTPAGNFVEPLTKRLKLEGLATVVVTVNSREYAQGCVDFKTGMDPKKGDEPNIVHVSQKPMTKAVSVANIRKLSDLWALSKDKSSDDISPFVAAVLALIGLKNHSTPPAADPWVRRR
jgi:phage terminase large subunit-like protein